jgi:FkbM family methyltransferase
MKFLRKRGFHVERERYSTPYLTAFGFEIATLVDVGVWEGTPALYDAFPSAHLVMVDPAPTLPEQAAAWPRSAGVTIINAGAGASETQAELGLARDCSSLMRRLDGIGQPTGTATVRIAPLDRLLAEHGASGPYGLKIDTEGYELEVLRGAKAMLAQTVFVLLEISLTERFADGYRPSQIVAELAANGFELRDVMPNAAHNRHFDALFVRA